jgi:hypothetical protein
MYQTTGLKFTTIVLNSVSNASKLPDLSVYQTINLFLDNDEAGLRTSKTILDRYPQAENQSVLIFPGRKDFNEFLINHSTNTATHE